MGPVTATGPSSALITMTTMSQALRRQFDLQEEDTEYLNAKGLPWETLIEGGTLWLLVHEWPVPDGYTIQTVSVALRLTGYPSGALDMAWFSPALARTDGSPIRATSVRTTIDGTPWQRWSRHRTSQNPWLPGVDGIPTHLALVEHWLEREFARA